VDRVLLFVVYMILESMLDPI